MRVETVFRTHSYGLRFLRLNIQQYSVKSRSHSRLLISGVDLWNASGVQKCVDIAIKDRIVVKIAKDLDLNSFLDFVVVRADGDGLRGFNFDRKK